MRITNNMLSKNLFAEVNRARERMADLQTDIATGKKIRRPQDEPAGFHRASNLKLLISRNEQYLRNIGQAVNKLAETTAALDHAVDLLTRAKEMAVQGASETQDVDSRQSLASGVAQILESLIGIGNSKYNGKFLFAGSRTIGEQPFVKESARVTYQGDAAVMRAQIGEDLQVVTNKPGDEVFSTGNESVFDALLLLQQSLEQNNTAGIQEAIGKLDGAIKHMLTIEADFGALQERLQATGDFLEAQNINLAAFVSEIENTDMLEATVRFQEAEMVYMAGLRSYSELVQTSLLNFIS